MTITLTGLTSGSDTLTANDPTSETTASLGVTVTAPGTNLVALPSNIDAIIGPTTDPTTDVEVPGAANLSAEANSPSLARAQQTVGDGSLPYVGVSTAYQTGTVAHTAGSATITGVGTAFSSQIPNIAGDYAIFVDIPAEIDPWGVGFIAHMQCTVVNDTTLAIVSYLGSALPTFSGLSWRISDTAHLGNANPVVDMWKGFTIYYDYPFCVYQEAYKNEGTSNGSAFMAAADSLAKLWWEHPFRAVEARYLHSDSNFSLSPREEALAGLMLWAVRGCPGATGDAAATVTRVWQFMVDCVVNNHYPNWYKPAMLESGTTIPYDVRDKAYVLHYMVQIAQGHPDSAVRTDALTKALATVPFWQRTQQPDGTWRAYTGGFWSDFTTGAQYLACQPFLTGLLLNALVDLHRAIRNDPSRTSDAATLLTLIKQGVRGQMQCYVWSTFRPGCSLSNEGHEIRGMTYSYGDGKLGFGVDGDNALPNLPMAEVPGSGGANRWNAESGASDNEGNYPSVSGIRFMNATTMHSPFYAALYSVGAEREEFLAFGDELLDSCWAYMQGDGLRSQYYTAYPKNKDHDEHFRAGLRALGWRRLVVTGATSEP